MDKKPSARPTEPAVADELRVLVERARAGDTGALPDVRRIVKSCDEIWQYARRETPMQSGKP